MTTNILKVPPATDAVTKYPYLAVHHPVGGPLDTEKILPCDVVILAYKAKNDSILVVPLSFNIAPYFIENEFEYHPLPKGSQFIIQQ